MPKRRRGYRPRLGWRAVAVALFAACALSACGGNNLPPSAAVAAAASTPQAVAPVQIVPSAPASAPVAASAPEPASTPVPTSKAVLIEIHGDDAMYGLTSQFSFGPTAQSEPADTQALLRDQLSDPAIEVSNLAEGGVASTLVNMMNGMDGGGPPFAQRMTTSKADIVLVNHAINDDLSQSLGPYTDALIAWVQAVRAAGKVAVIEEPNPVCDGNHPYLENYVSTMDSIAVQYNVPLVKQYDALKAVPNYCSHLAAGFYPDDAIYAIKAQREAAVLAPLVKNIIGE